MGAGTTRDDVRLPNYALAQMAASNGNRASPGRQPSSASQGPRPASASPIAVEDAGRLVLALKRSDHQSPSAGALDAEDAQRLELALRRPTYQQQPPTDGARDAEDAQRLELALKQSLESAGATKIAVDPAPVAPSASLGVVSRTVVALPGHQTPSVPSSWAELPPKPRSDDPVDAPVVEQRRDVAPLAVVSRTVVAALSGHRAPAVSSSWAEMPPKAPCPGSGVGTVETEPLDSAEMKRLKLVAAEAEATEDGRRLSLAISRSRHDELGNEGRLALEISRSHQDQTSDEKRLDLSISRSRDDEQAHSDKKKVQIDRSFDEEKPEEGDENEGFRAASRSDGALGVQPSASKSGSRRQQTQQATRPPPTPTRNGPFGDGNEHRWVEVTTVAAEEASSTIPVLIDGRQVAVL